MPFVAMVSFSALPNAGNFLKRLSAQPAGMTAFNCFEPSLLTLQMVRLLQSGQSKHLSWHNHAKEIID